MEKITVFTPATVANVNCGFDLLGFALEGIGDEITLTKSSKKGIEITSIEGANLPLGAEKNVAGVAGNELLKALSLDFGFQLQMKKRIPVGSGIGGSAASASGVVFAINEFLGKPLSNIELTKFAMKGEAIASGCEHADNVAPALYGGFTLIPNYEPLQVVSLPVPNELFAVIIHPKIEIKTKEARGILPEKVAMKAATQQTGNLAGLVASLYTSDYKLLSECCKDVLVEPHRKSLIPCFDEAKKTALQTGTLAFGISGSGPSMFSICKGEASAKLVVSELKKIYETNQISIDHHLSKISEIGSKVL